MLRTGLAASAPTAVGGWAPSAQCGDALRGPPEGRQILGVLLEVGTTARAPLHPSVRMCAAGPVTPVTTVLLAPVRY